LGEDWLDPLEDRVRQSIRGFIEQLVEAELEAFLGRRRYGRGGPVAGHRHGRRERHLLGTFGPTTVSLPRARIREADGREREWKSNTLPAYKRLTKRAEALIAGVYLAGTNTRRVRRALQGLFAGAVSKDTVIRAWHRVQGEWQAWQKRDLAGDAIIRLILDGTVVKVRIDRQATVLSILVAMGVRQDGQKVVLAIRTMGGESQAAWRAVLDDLVARGLAPPGLVIVDGAPGLEAALAALWPEIPVQRCSVHKERNLLAHAPKRLHDEIKADSTEMMYADTVQDVLAKRKAFLRKWHLKCRPVADSLEEAGNRLFTFLRYPRQQWKSIRTTNAIERLNEEFRRRIKTQCVLPNHETVCMLFWALLASGQIVLGRVDGWETLAAEPTQQPLDLAA
jgi:transposase-like protein